MLRSKQSYVLGLCTVLSISCDSAEDGIRRQIAADPGPTICLEKIPGPKDQLNYDFVTCRDGSGDTWICTAKRIHPSCIPMSSINSAWDEFLRNFSNIWTPGAERSPRKE
jgi:hypothetical protein